METRQREILNLVVSEYIKTAEPVGSQILVEKYKLNVSPATVRMEMVELSDRGYLHQPHTSAGRVPTDKAYRFFVDQLGQDDFSSSEFKILLEVIEGLNQGGFGLPRLVRDTARTISFVSSGVGICGSLDEDDFFSAGLPNLLREPEFARDADFFKSLEIFDTLDREIKNIFNEIEKDVQVFIGRESREKRFNDFSLVVSRCENKRMKRGFVGVLGPKRMDYEKNIQLVSCAKEAIKEL
ncbi:MAG: hypothetical protein HY813_03000 [Candidatus Portnoybacteria bacterium]|nr:hypothetical protein [Candidatus Portnoybacteria bacterium]